MPRNSLGDRVRDFFSGSGQDDAAAEPVKEETVASRDLTMCEKVAKAFEDSGYFEASSFVVPQDGVYVFAVANENSDACGATLKVQVPYEARDDRMAWIDAVYSQMADLYKLDPDIAHSESIGYGRDFCLMQAHWYKELPAFEEKFGEAMCEYPDEKSAEEAAFMQADSMAKVVLDKLGIGSDAEISYGHGEVDIGILYAEHEDRPNETVDARVPFGVADSPEAWNTKLLYDIYDMGNGERLEELMPFMQRVAEAFGEAKGECISRRAKEDGAYSLDSQCAVANEAKDGQEPGGSGPSGRDDR